MYVFAICFVEPFFLLVCCITNGIYAFFGSNEDGCIPLSELNKGKRTSPNHEARK